MDLFRRDKRPVDAQEEINITQNLSNLDNELRFWAASKSHTAMYPFKVINGFHFLADSGKEPKQKRGRRKSPEMQMSFSFIK